MEQHVNAGIKSKKELAERLLAGEVFYDNNSEVVFDPSRAIPFRFGEDALKWGWDRYQLFTKKVNWYDNIPEKGVLCWVSDLNENPNGSDIVDVIQESRIESAFPFIGRRTNWVFATPVKPYECLGVRG